MPKHRASPTPLARELRKTRLQMGLSQAELGKKIGVSYEVIARMEHGEPISALSAFKAAEFFGFDWTRFFPDDASQEDCEAVA